MKSNSKHFIAILVIPAAGLTLSLASCKEPKHPLYEGLSEALREQLRNTAFLDIQMSADTRAGIKTNLLITDQEDILEFANAIDMNEDGQGNCYCMGGAVVTYSTADDQLTSFVIISNRTLDWESNLVGDGRIPSASFFLTEESSTKLTNWFARHGQELDQRIIIDYGKQPDWREVSE